MLLVPKHELGDAKLKHLRLNLATAGSTSVAAPGTGFSWMPVYMWANASAAASIELTNGTGGTNLIEMKLAAATSAEIHYWEEPNVYLSNKALVIETATGIGVSDIHVWYTKVRSGAGSDGVTQ